MIPVESRIVLGDVMTVLPGLPAGIARCCVTSPPYWGLRDYGIPPTVWGGDPSHVHEWQEKIPGDRRKGQRGATSALADRKVAAEQVAARTVSRGQFCACGAWLGCFGLEPTPELYLEHAVMIFREVRRVLADDGTLWLNMGDCYISNTKSDEGDPKYKGGHDRIDNPNRKPIPGLKPKDLLGMPWRLAFALQADGWYLRSDIIWHKPNPMPGSQVDRPTTAHEYLFLLSKSAKYFYDKSAIAEIAVTNDAAKVAGWATTGKHSAIDHAQAKDLPDGQLNIRKFRQNARAQDSRSTSGMRNKRSVWTIPTEAMPEAHFATFPEKLVEPCVLAGSAEGDLVLDPFSGSGTTALVAAKLNRRYLGIEVNPEYVAISKRRLDGVVAQQTLFTAPVSMRPPEHFLFADLEPDPETFVWNDGKFSNA
jgi:DNA modification methylase